MLLTRNASIPILISLCKLTFWNRGARLDVRVKLGINLIGHGLLSIGEITMILNCP